MVVLQYMVNCKYTVVVVGVYKEMDFYQMNKLVVAHLQDSDKFKVT